MFLFVFFVLCFIRILCFSVECYRRYSVFYDSLQWLIIGNLSGLAEDNGMLHFWLFCFFGSIQWYGRGLLVPIISYTEKSVKTT